MSVTLLPVQTRATPDTMVLFYSIDDQPKFAASTCHPGTLFAAVAKAMFGEHVLSREPRDEVAGAVGALLEKGGLDFEDGWLVLKSGLGAVVEYLMGQVKEARDDEVFADGERCKLIRENEDIGQRYNGLRDALREALGSNGGGLPL